MNDEEINRELSIKEMKAWLASLGISEIAQDNHIETLYNDHGFTNKASLIGISKNDLIEVNNIISDEGAKIPVSLRNRLVVNLARKQPTKTPQGDAANANIVSSKWNRLVPKLMKIAPPSTDNKVDEDNEVKSDERMASAAAETKQEAVPKLINFAPSSTNNRADDENQVKANETLALASAETKEEEKEYKTKQEGGSQQESGCSDDEGKDVEPSLVKSDVVDEKESRGFKRGKDPDESYDNCDSKRIKYWTAHKKPIAVPTDEEWYLGHKGEDLFIRQSTEDCFNIIWEEVVKSREEWARKKRDGYVAFVITGAPGLGKSWCSNAMVWYLLDKRQSMWFHSAGDKTLTKIEFPDDNAPPVMTDLPENHVLTRHPPPGTWFLYESVGNTRSGQRLIEFTSQPPGVPCIIFSSPKDTNYVNGITAMESSPIGGKVWYLWMPTWAWDELETVMPSLYKSFAGHQSRRSSDEFKEFVKAMYDIWGGIPRRFATAYSTLEDQGKDVAIAETQEKFETEMATLAPQVIHSGPMIDPSRLEALHQKGERDSGSQNVSPPSWLMHPLPIESTRNPFREASYRFCSRKAEVLFLKHLAGQEVSVVRNFCRQLFAVHAGYGLAFEGFAHFVLTRTEASDYRWRKYDGTERQKLTLPKCTELPKCDMKTDLGNYQEQIVKFIEEQKDGVIDPLSDQQDAIDMFIVFKDGRVFAMQDTISKTHSFHPVKILEYRKAAKEALESAGKTLPDDFFKHVVVVPTEEELSKFKLEFPTMPGLDSNIETVVAKFNELGLNVPAGLDSRTKKDALSACQKAKLKTSSKIKVGEARIKGAEADLLIQAKVEVESMTWVLDGLEEK